MAGKKTNIVKLPEKATIQNAKKIWKDTVTKSKKKKDIGFDFSKVEEIDLSLFQILAAVKKSINPDIEVFFVGPIKKTVFDSAILAGFVSEARDIETFCTHFYEFL